MTVPDLVVRHGHRMARVPVTSAPPTWSPRADGRGVSLTGRATAPGARPGSMASRRSDGAAPCDAGRSWNRSTRPP